jgi:hypothetical protein
MSVHGRSNLEPFYAIVYMHDDGDNENNERLEVDSKEMADMHAFA